MLVPNSDETIKENMKKRDSEFSLDMSWVSNTNHKKKVFFIVPVQNLIEQQAATIERYTNLVVGRYLGR